MTEELRSNTERVPCMWVRERMTRACNGVSTEGLREIDAETREHAEPILTLKNVEKSNDFRKPTGRPAQDVQGPRRGGKLLKGGWRAELEF